jgi:hypothetical protein
MTLAHTRHPQIFEKSRLKDGYRGILDRAHEDGAVLIRDSGAQNLYIVREDVFGALETTFEEAADFAQLMAAVAEVFQPRPRQLVIDRLKLGRLGWAADLTAESFRMFVAEYVVGYHDAVTTGNWSTLRQLLVEWRDTAGVERDPDLMARLLDLGHPDQHADLPRPSDA